MEFFLIIGGLTLAFIILSKIPGALSRGRQSIQRKLSREPERVQKTLSFGRFNVAGVTHKNLDGRSRQTLIRRCVRVHESYDKDVDFDAVPERDNPHDPNAIRINAEETWETKAGEAREKFIGCVGYVPREIAAQIYEQSGEPFNVIVIGPQFYAFENEKGQHIVGLSLEAASFWWDDVQKKDNVTSQCLSCVHFNQKDSRNDIPRCSAFPGGIPAALWENRASHALPYEGDGGKRFTKKAY